VAKQSWSDLVADYDITRGRTWPYVLAWITIGPSVVRSIDRRPATLARVGGTSTWGVPFFHEEELALW